MDTGATNSTPLVSLTERDPARGHCQATAATAANQALRQRRFPWRPASIAQAGPQKEPVELLGAAGRPLGRAQPIDRPAQLPLRLLRHVAQRRVVQHAEQAQGVDSRHHAAVALFVDDDVAG